MRIFIKTVLLILCLSQAVYAEEDYDSSALSLDQATKKIIDSKKVKVLGATTEFIDEKEVHVIKVLTKKGRIKYFKVDVNTGEISR